MASRTLNIGNVEAVMQPPPESSLPTLPKLGYNGACDAELGLAVLLVALYFFLTNNISILIC
jgi:hypothetical protein